MLNLNALKDVVGDDQSMMKELLDQFIETTLDDMRNLQDAVAAGNVSDVASFAHRIKGSCFVVGAEQLADIADQLEQGGRQKNKQHFSDLSDKITVAFQDVRDEIERL